MGADCANWSKVMHCPLAWAILALAALVNFKAQILSPCGTFNNLTSLVTAPTTATILPSTLDLSLDTILAILEMEMGYLLSLDWLSRLWMTLLNPESVLLERKE